MKIGITATREGATKAQISTLKYMLDEWLPGDIDELHHGDCVGGDAQAHEVALWRHIPVVVHPPTVGKYRAHCGPADGTRKSVPVTILKPLPYLTRDRNIVKAVDLLIAMPLKGVRTKGSGTWYTVNYAIDHGVDHYIINPDGVFWTLLRSKRPKGNFAPLSESRVMAPETVAQELRET